MAQRAPCTRWASSIANGRRAAFARQLIEAGELGEIVHYRGRFFHDYGLDPAMPVTWRLQQGGLGRRQRHRHRQPRHRHGPPSGRRDRGRVRHSRTHFARRPLAGRPGESAPVDVDEITDMLVEFESGASGTLQTSWLAGGHKMDIGFAVHGTRARSSTAPNARPRSASTRPATRPATAASGRFRSARRTRAASCSGRSPGWRSASAKAS